jgi:actin-related protein
MALLSEGFESYSDLDKAIKNIESAIKRSNKANGEGEEEVRGRWFWTPILNALTAEAIVLFATIQEEEIQTFPLVDTPDDQLDEEGKKEKRKQKLLKSNYDARMRMKAEKKAEKERLVRLSRHEAI